MGYTVSVTVKPLTSSKIGMSIGHDFRTSFTRNVRNNNSNRIINLSNGYVENFKSNDNLINQNLKYNFNDDGSLKLKDKKNNIDTLNENNITNKKLELEIQEPKIQIKNEEQKQEPEISKKEISLPFFVQIFKFIKFNINKVNYYYRKIAYHNTS